MAQQNVTVRAGSDVFGLLGVAFVVLKLVGVIHWSWVWVLAPFWITLAVFVIALGCFLVANLLD